MSDAIALDLAHVPFSRRDSYLALSTFGAAPERAAGLYLRTLHGDAPRREICRIELLRDGKIIAASAEATPHCLYLRSPQGSAEICFADSTTLRIRASGSGIRLIFHPELYDCAVRQSQSWEINSFSNRIRIALIPIRGAMSADAPWQGDRAAHMIVDIAPDARGHLEFALAEMTGDWPASTAERDFDSCVRSVDAEFQQWLQTMPACPKHYAATRSLAAYVLWSCTVAPQGHFTRRAVLMSKNWLSNVWSWDHCFNAMALIDADPALAWDQFMLPFDCQHANGALPDSINDQLLLWNFRKPPIHGWALQWMLQRSSSITLHHLREIYQPLCRWTEWWLQRCDSDGLGQYLHGNDSGWDNASVFDNGLPVTSPDLSALLIVQMQVLADIAQRLRRSRAAQQWQQRADTLLTQLLAHGWRGDQFVAQHCGRAVTGGDSLLLFLPLVLGKKLPAPVRRALLAGLQQAGRFLGPHGFASESYNSPCYEADGYWRGPIWAPATLLLVEALAAGGAKALARTIARRFCDLVACSGMAENYDARSGAGLRDRAHSWSASVFLILAGEYLKK